LKYRYKHFLLFAFPCCKTDSDPGPDRFIQLLYNKMFYVE